MVQPDPRTGPDIAYRGFRTAAQFGTGSTRGTLPTDAGLVLSTPDAEREYTDPHTGRTGRYESATWTSPPVSPGFAATEVIPSWTAETPGGSWIEIELRGRTETGSPTGWYTVARWAGDDAAIRRTSVPAQADADGAVDADTFTARPGRRWTSWRLRATLHRPAGGADVPVLRSIGAVASRPPALPDAGPHRPAPTGTTGAAATGDADPGRAADRRPAVGRGVTLDVPPFSQEVHTGHYPRWDGGGESWCSPTSTAMVLAYWGTGPGPDEYAWVGPDDPRPCVDHAARQCFDYAYAGAGNWPFNTAYAGRYGLDAFVTRLRSLAEAERFIAAGIPLVVSASYRRGQVPGLDYDTDGHLLVLVGFTPAGDPVLNDPKSPADAAVRKPVDRGRFETVWLSARGGLAYVIRPAGTPLPPPPAQANW